MKLLDTCFLISLQREIVRNTVGHARRYLMAHAGEEFSISTITVLEFLEGFSHPADGERFLEPFPKLDATIRVAHVGSRIRRNLRKQGKPIGDFDILIAATAINAAIPLVTNNLDHFQRIDGLVIESYSQP